MKLGRTRLKLHVTTAVTLGISLQCNMTPCSLVISSDSRKEYFASEIRVDGPAELPHGSYTKWCGLHSFIHSVDTVSETCVVVVGVGFIHLSLVTVIFERDENLFFITAVRPTVGPTRHPVLQKLMM